MFLFYKFVWALDNREFMNPDYFNHLNSLYFLFVSTHPLGGKQPEVPSDKNFTFQDNDI